MELVIPLRFFQSLSGDQDDLYANSENIQVDNLVSILNGYFDSNGYVNVNVLNRKD